MIYTHVDVSIYHTVHTFHRDIVLAFLSYTECSVYTLVQISLMLFWCFLLTNISQTYIFPLHSNDLHQLSALWRCRYLVFSSTLPHRKKALPVFCKESSISKHVCIVISRTENLSWNYNLNIQYKLSFQQTFIYTWVLLTIIKYLP